MTACTQPGCIGTIVDRYCDVCGSPAGAIPFVPAEAATSAGPPIPSDEPGAVGRGSQVSPKPKGEALDTTCAQPGCTGTIVDGYCDVCGSPTGAVPYAPAEAAAPTRSPAPADEKKVDPRADDIEKVHVEQELLEDIQGSREVEAILRRLIAPVVADVEEGDTAEDGAAVADVEEGDTSDVRAAVAETEKADRPPAGRHDDDTVEIPAVLAVPGEGRPNHQLLEPPAPTPASALADEVEEEEEEALPTQRIPRVKVPTQQLSAQEMADPTAGDPTAGDAQKGEGEKELAEDGPNDAQGYRTRVDEAQLPGDVREAALREVGKLERTSDQSPESDEIRNWLDTVLDLSWSTKIMDSIDIQESREVEAALQRLIEPAVADVEEAHTADVEPVGADFEEDNTAKVDPAAADSENADRASAGPHDDDTAQTPAVLAGFTGRRHPRPHLPEQQVVRLVLVETPTEKSRFRSLALAATVVVVLLIGALLFAVGRDRGVTAQSAPTVTATATATVSKPTSQPSAKSTGTETIQLDDVPDTGRPFQTVPIQGRFRGGPDTFLRVQRWEGGKWLDFPLTTKTDRSGKFTAYVEPGGPGRYELRVLDSDSLVTSKTFVVVIKG